jgi:hypothetical protein
MNHTLLSKVLIFAAGAAIGSAVTWVFVKKRYEQIANEEIESVKRVFSNREEESAETETVEEAVEPEQEPELDEKAVERKNYRDIIKETNYNTVAKQEVEEEDVEYFVEPYVISPDEFGDLAEDGYDTESYYLYDDGILENAITKDLIDDEDIDKMFGRDAFDHFGEYEPDSVCVRNENHQIDYEILKANKSYGG